MSDGEEDDPIVLRVPVYVRPAEPQAPLCLFQYPTRSHLVRCETCHRHGQMFQVCRPCIKKHEDKFSGRDHGRHNCFPLFCPGCCANMLKLKAHKVVQSPQTACTHTEKIALTRLS